MSIEGRRFVIIIFAAYVKGTTTFRYQDSTSPDLPLTGECGDAILSLQQNSQDGLDSSSIICPNNILLHNVNCLCRQESYVVLQWNLTLDNINFQSFDEIIFEVEKLTISSLSTNNNWIKINKTSSHKIKINSLSANYQYQFKVTPFFKGVQLGLSSQSDHISTFVGNETLDIIKNVRIEKINYKNGAANVLVHWDPPDDAVCETIIVVPGHHGMIDLKVVEAENYLELDGLSYESSLTLLLYSRLEDAESKEVRLNIEVPTCLNLTHYNYLLCAPESPQNLNVVETCSYFKISWDKPLINPDYYYVMFTSETKAQNYTVQGNDSSVKIDITQIGNFYSVYVLAASPAGLSRATVSRSFSKCNHLNDEIKTEDNLSENGTVAKIPLSLTPIENCKFEVSWDKPQFSLNYYLIKISLNNKTQDYTISGNATSFKLNLMDNGNALVQLTAFGSDGKLGYNSVSGKSVCNKILHGNNLTAGRIAAIFAAALSTPIVILVIRRILLCFYTSNKEVDRMQPEDSFRKVSSNKYEDIDTDESNKEEKSILDDKIYDEYEVGRHHVRICQVLGEGEFGIVYKAVLVEDNTYHKYVAVKTLRNKESVEEKRQLEKEIEVMKSVGRHRNIVSLLGCCSKDMMLIVEYCSQGDLRRFLRRTWRMKTYMDETVIEKNSIDKLERIAFSNMLYENSGLEKNQLNLSMMDLLSFARQIALGMVYLSENRVVHRDLAARNVLLADDMTAKIADFGLSRDVYERNIYMKSSSDRLPLRWMALESLQYQVFSTKSDVWSYGILLWEIMTLGGCPYPSLQTSEMYQLLQKGYRMERPKPCTPLLYDIMLSCWDAKPQNRPTFSQLVSKVEEIMKNESNRSYLDLSTCNYKSHLDKGYDIKLKTYLN